MPTEKTSSKTTHAVPSTLSVLELEQLYQRADGLSMCAAAAALVIGHEDQIVGTWPAPQAVLFATQEAVGALHQLGRALGFLLDDRAPQQGEG